MTSTRAQEIYDLANAEELRLAAAPEIIAAAEEHGTLYDFEVGQFVADIGADDALARALNNMARTQGGLWVYYRRLRPQEFIGNLIANGQP